MEVQYWKKSIVSALARYKKRFESNFSKNRFIMLVNNSNQLIIHTYIVLQWNTYSIRTIGICNTENFLQRNHWYYSSSGSCLLMLVVILALIMLRLIFPSLLPALLNSITNIFEGLSSTFNTSKNLGIWFHCTCHSTSFHTNLPSENFNNIPTPIPCNFPSFPEVNPTELTCLYDAAYANNPFKCQSATGYIITLASVAIVYWSKTQTVTALSSTEAEFYAAVAAFKIIMFLCSIITDLLIPPSFPTPVYEDNKQCIKVINVHHPTEWTQHIDTPYFEIQDCNKKDRGDIKIHHTLGIFNPSENFTKHSAGYYNHAISVKLWDTIFKLYCILFYILSVLYLYTFFALLMKIKKGIVQGTGNRYDTYVLVSIKDNDILII